MIDFRRIRSSEWLGQFQPLRGGKTITLEGAETDPDLASMPSWLERKLLRFRSINDEGCDH